MKRVLVLLSAYQGQKYIGEQIESLIRQLGVSIHVLLRDDGSPSQEALDIVRKYQKKDIPITIISGSNLGFSLSFSKLIEESSKHYRGYDYYAFCDQDDVWLDDKLLAAIEILDKNGAGDNKIPVTYCSNTTLVDKKLTPISKRSSSRIPRLSKSRSLIQSYATGCTMVFNQCALDLYANHMPEKLYAHDMMMYQMCMFLGKVIYDPVSHILYRQHGHNQIGSHGFWGRMKNRLSFKKHKGTLLKQSQCFLSLYKDVLSLEDIAIISKLAFYKTSFFNRLSLMFDKDIKYDRLEPNFFFILKVIWGGV